MVDPYKAKWIPLLFDAINSQWPNRTKTQDGTVGDAAHRQQVSGHNPDDTAGVLAERSDADTKPEVRAADVDARGVVMQAVIDGIIADPAERSRFIYVIFNRHIWRASNGWEKEPYTGSDPHDLHAHFSGHPDHDEDDRPFKTIYSTGADDMSESWTQPLTQGAPGYAGHQRDTALAFAWKASNEANEGVQKLLDRPPVVITLEMVTEGLIQALRDPSVHSALAALLAEQAFQGAQRAETE